MVHHSTESSCKFIICLPSCFLIYLEVFDGKWRQKFGAQNLALVLLKFCRLIQNWTNQFLLSSSLYISGWVYIVSRFIPSMQSATAALKDNISREADWASSTVVPLVIWMCNYLESYQPTTATSTTPSASS